MTTEPLAELPVEQRKAAIWVRVSTTDQTTANQLLMLRRVCANRGLQVAHVFDVAASAYKGDHQSALDDMLTKAGRGEFQVLVCWALDRLERRGGEYTLQLLATLGKRRVSVISYQESWVESAGDPSIREFLLYFTGWVAKSESRRRSERTLAGLERARSQGKRLGRPPGAKDDETKRSRRSTGQRVRWSREKIEAEARKAGGQ